MFKFHCPHCQQKLSAEPTQSGATLQCPVCGVDFVIPSPTDEVVIQPQSPEDSAEVTASRDIHPEQSSQPEPSPEPGASHSLAERLRDGNKAAQEGAKFVKKGAMVGWAGLKRRSKQAALKAQIEKLRNIDLRKALHSLGKKAFEQGAVAEGVAEQFQAIRDLDARIAEMRDKAAVDAGETKMAALKRVSKDTAKASQAQALTVKREHLITELGREIHARKSQMSEQELSDESAAIADIEHRIRDKERKIRELGGEEASASSSSGGTRITPFSYRSAVPLFVCCLGFGWLVTWLLPMRIFTPELAFSSAFGVVLLALPPLLISYYAVGRFLGYPRSNYKHLLGAMAFTMFAGILILLTFYKIAEASQSMKSGFYGRATPLVLAVKLIGWSADFHTEGNFFQRLFASVVHAGFCEEVTKLLPLFLLLILNRKKDGVPDLRAFLMIAFFSGLGFGIAEAVKAYSPWSGNPVLTSNVIRWYACVPLHAIYTIIDASLLWLLIPEFKKAKSIGVASAILLTAATVVAVIHGLYNTISGLHNLIGLILDGGAIAFMVFIVRFCVNREQNSINTTNGHPFPTGILPAWLRSKDRNHPSFGRMFAGAGILLLISTVFAFSPPPLSSSAAQSFAAEVESQLGIVFDDEAALMYAGGYAIGASANRPAPPGAFEYIVNQTMAQTPGLPAAFGDLMLLGMKDGYNHMPNRLESAGGSFDELHSVADQSDENYRSNSADQIVMRRFEEAFRVAHTIGKRQGANDMEVMRAAIDSTDWSGASRPLRDAVKDFMSIRSGESPVGNRKMETMVKFINIYCD